MAIDWQLYHWHIEPSSICALRCPRCPRVEHPDTPWLNHSMSLDFFKSFLTAELLQSAVKRITMCGDVGDPIYCKQYLDIYQYIKEVNPKIHVVTITNGSGRPTNWWQRLAEIANNRDCVNFSIDGYDQESNNLYRINSNWQSIMSGIKTLRQHNRDVFINWAMIVFKFNQTDIAKIRNLARDLQMDALQITKSTKFGSKYGEAYHGDQDPLEPDDEWISTSHRYERFSENLSGRNQDRGEYLQQNQQRWQLIQEKYQSQPIVPLCEIGNRGIYVNAEGVVFPCSWVSFPYKSLSHKNKTIFWADSFFAKYRAHMNLHQHSLSDIMKNPLWNQCSNGWHDPDKTWVECLQKCHRGLVDRNYAVGWETN